MLKIVIVFLLWSSVNSSEEEFGQIKTHAKRAAIAKKGRLWDDGIIPYEIDNQFSGEHKALFIRAMRHWENYTCITFVPRKRTRHQNFIYFTIRQCGCCSFVGKQGSGGQTISIGKNCDKFGIVVHELGHVIGLWHEHTRPDRDDHVVIDKNNIMDGHQNNFNKLTEQDVDSLGLQYDFQSIMHYARNTFSKGTYLDTIFPKNERSIKRSELGQRVRLSAGDVRQVNLLYNCPICGQTFQNNSGSFSSADYIGSSSESELCIWRITASQGEKISLNLTSLDLFLTLKCDVEYLEIRDGYRMNSTLLQKYCGSKKPNHTILSTGTRIILILKTIKHEQKKYLGFSASYKAICGGNLQIRQSIRVESPNYPLNYLPSKECVWILRVRSGSKVALKFQSFDLENHDKCRYDYVEVRDGGDSNSTLLGRYCGLHMPPILQSSQEQMFVKFVSDRSAEKSGFVAFALREEDECAKDKHGCQQQCINTIGGYKCSCEIGFQLQANGKSCENACGGQISERNGTISSPSYPDLYPKLKHCVWEIMAPVQHRIILNFTHFDVEGSKYRWQDCSYDSVRIYSSIRNASIKEYGTFCGLKVPQIVLSESNNIRIEFKSDETIQRSGFLTKFYSEIDECRIKNGGCAHMCHKTIGSYKCTCRNGFILDDDGKNCRKGCNYFITSQSGSIMSPNYPNAYPNNTNCVWRISTIVGHRVELNFTTFQLEQHQECAYDRLTIYNGLTPKSFTLGHFCGTTMPGIIRTTSNNMLIVFKADSSGQKIGFLANFTSICGGYLVADDEPKTLVSHPEYGLQKYQNKFMCEWTLEANHDKSVRLSFDFFDIEDDPDCAYDSVKIIDGYSDKVLDTFCGSSLPKVIESTYETLIIRFQTDSTVVFRGFSATFISVDPFEEESVDKFEMLK